ncbi:MAG: EamA family transporter [Candidatus Omnitrophota bacterium]|nr:EamA family transporter [Candidatus Omnitrophota bacterium]MBU1929659.1 EamA family transporter [Candidatus Omnitrophota bacterium]MBU2035385.1 EamA family transporter [Candidatus Omnitrophota bacterium]MBU2221198.1 EamA family transporter [Candidatus Omnitrophota bacterium]MBU2257510.1 EamA family transporter [Candidatus Omnitrophota bacterium]
MNPNLIFIIFLIVITSICDASREILTKFAVNSLDTNVDGFKKAAWLFIQLIMIPWVWLGFLISILSLFIWLYVLSKADLNFAFSVDSMHYLFVALASRIFLKEKVGLARWMGTFLIVVGIILVSLG